MSDTSSLSPELASQLAAIALDNVRQEYPHKLDHVMLSDVDVLPPRVLHPAFHASYDWHSCVHMHWLLVHLRRLFPQLPQRAAIEEICAAHFAPDAIAGECAYLDRSESQAFERTYGWAWLLKLALELALARDATSVSWQRSLAPLVQRIEARYLAYLPRADYPIRYGMHSNSAFGLAFAIEHARFSAAGALERACAEKALAWFRDDIDAPVAWEPSGADFLSPALVEAMLMRLVRANDEHGFATWLSAFLPDLQRGRCAPLLQPVRVSDRSDAQIVHLDGLNLSRAWCWRGIADGLPAGDSRIPIAREAASAHLRAGMEGVHAASYSGSHWLASFAALALS
ncbi:MAG: DUF2891 domain-containing protein [Pseudomonadota bacterium]|nr:DUF2891 domain-containing protein [Pseudomonadota bacterium]